MQLNYQCINVSLRTDGTRSWLVFHLPNLITSEADEYLSSISETAGRMTIIPFKLKHMQAFMHIFKNKHKHTSLYTAHFLFPFAWEHLLSSSFSSFFFVCLFVYLHDVSAPLFLSLYSRILNHVALWSTWKQTVKICATILLFTTEMGHDCLVYNLCLIYCT